MNIKFDKEVTQLFLNGAQVVRHWDSHNNEAQTILVRLQKGNFVEYRDKNWEFVYCQNYDKRDTLIVAGYRNGNIRTISKEIFENHHDFRRHFKLTTRAGQE